MTDQLFINSLYLTHYRGFPFWNVILLIRAISARSVHSEIPDTIRSVHPRLSNFLF